MIREVFFDLARRTVRLLEDAALAEAWDQPSALVGYDVGALAGHLARAVLTVDKYLGQPAKADAAVGSAAEYFAAVLGDHHPVDSELHQSVRARGQETGSIGPSALAADLRAALERLQPLLADATLDTNIQVLDGLTMKVGEYVKTRVVELVVHMDDLAVSVGGVRVDVPEDACVLVAGVLGELAALRAGGLNAVRSLARAERHSAPLRAL